MSAIITGRVFWTPFKELSYQDKKGKIVKIKETTAKIVMLSIADSADDYGENSWQSFETISQKSSIERRSVIRVVRALIVHKYLSVAGITQYGTNNFSINKDLLGHPPAKRSRVGRPKASDSEAKIGDSGAQTSDSQAKTSDPASPDPLIKSSLSIQKEKDSLIQIISAVAYSIFSDVQIWWNVKRTLESDAVSISGDIDKRPNLDDPMKITISGLSEKPKGGQFTLAQIWEARFTKSFHNLGIAITFQE